MRRRVGALGCPESATGKVFLALLWKGFIRLAHYVLNPITLFNARPQSGKLEKPLTGAYPFPPNGSCMHTGGWSASGRAESTSPPLGVGSLTSIYRH